MSRGGRGGARGGGRKTGPDMSWQDEDPSENTAPLKRIPGPIFPERHLAMPVSLSATEKTQVRFLIDVRERIRNGPLYTVLEKSQLLDDKGKVNNRAGFDPFNDQERFTRKYHRRRRTVPDHSERGDHVLKLFPVELWPTLDPRKRQTEYWNTLSDDVKARLGGTRGTKRKREKLNFKPVDDENDPAALGDREMGSEDESEEDGIIDGVRRRKKVAAKTRRPDPTQSKRREKKGLDAEDDYPEVEQQEDDGEGHGGAGGEDEPQDSEFGSDEDDDAYDDYNAENYFDDGADDEMGDADDDGGGAGGDYY